MSINISTNGRKTEFAACERSMTMIGMIVSALLIVFGLGLLAYAFVGNRAKASARKAVADNPTKDSESADTAAAAPPSEPSSGAASPAGA